MADRRTPARGPQGRPSRTRRPVRRSAAESPAESSAQRPAARARRPRLTSRAAVLVLVVAVLAVSYASSAKAYLQQRHDITAVQQEIAERQQAIGDLQDQLDRWKDPAYVAEQARARFGYVMPGETAYVALDADGEKIQPEAELGTPTTSDAPPTAWWDSVWSSLEFAGDPPKKDAAPPASKITEHAASAGKSGKQKR